MAYPQGFTYVSGPVFIREFNSESTATYAALQPVMLSNNNFKITESSGTASSIVGFSMHRAVDSVPAGKVLVSIPADRTIYASICSNNIAASALSSGVTMGIVKSGNTFYLRSLRRHRLLRDRAPRRRFHHRFGRQFGVDPSSDGQPAGVRAGFCHDHHLTERS